MNNVAWFNKYIGKKWDLNNYNCWGLVRDVYKQELGLDLPQYRVENNSYQCFSFLIQHVTERNNWFEVRFPKTFDLLLFWSNIPIHIGVYDKKRNGVIHATERSGVIFQRLQLPGLTQWQKIQLLRRK